MRIDQPVSTEPGVWVNNADGGPYIHDSWTDFKTLSPHGSITTLGKDLAEADAVWTPLTVVPAGMDWVDIMFRLEYRHATGAAGFRCWARAFGSSVAMSVGGDRTTIISVRAPPHASIESHDTLEVKVPIDTLRRFDFKWERTTSVQAVENLFAKLIGYGKNGSL